MTITTTPGPEHPAAHGAPAAPSPAPATTPPGRRNRLDRSTERLQSTLQRLWSDWRLGLGAALATAAAWGLVAGLLTPRGPLTSSEALWSIAISFGIGGTAGLVARSRWAILAAPAAFAAVFELVRAGTGGPTVDGIHASTYGLLAFVVGRGFHGLLSLVPMALGAAIGAGTARSVGQDAGAGGRGVRYGRRVVAGVVGLALIALSIGLARPASTAPIVDANGDQVAGSIAELTSVESNGHDLPMMIRGHSIENPVLLFLAGGPGGSELGAMRNHLPQLEEYFTVVTWDQRGTGRAYDELDPGSALTLAGSIDDTIAVTNYLRERFGQDEIYLAGQSWGTVLGVLAVQDHPELYRAFIGSGQMVSPVATDRIFYEDTVAWAMTSGQTGLLDELVSIGPPPYDEMFPYETALAHEHDVYPYDHSLNAEGEGGFSENFIVSEYALIDQVHLLGAFMDTFAMLYPQIQEIDFRRTATEFETPMFFVQGANEARGRAEPFDEWYPMIEAPIKEMAVLETSGHRPLWEQPHEFVEFMVGTVLTQTSPTNPER